MDAINLPANIALPTSSGAPAAPLQPGQVVQALVLELLQSGAFRLQLPQAVVDVRTDVVLTPGDTIALAAKGTGSGVRLEILSPGNTAAPATSNPANSPTAASDASVAAAVRRPIGEAVVVGRVNSAPAAPAPAVAAPIAAARPDITPPRALVEAVRVAATRQGGLAPLFADVEQATTLATLPAPVRAAAAQLLDLRVALDEHLTAADVKQAFTRSGVLLEPQLAAATRSPPGAPTLTPDLKATLLVLRQALKTWAGEAPQITPVAQAVASPAFTSPPLANPALAKLDPLAALPTGAAPPLSPEEAESVAHPILASPTLANPTLAKLEAALAIATLAKLDPLAALSAGASPPLSPEEAESVAKNIASALLAKAEVPQAQPPASGGPPPPYRGAPLTPQPPAPAAIADDLAPRAVADKLIAGTDAAISRQTLLQAASLPDAASLDAPRDASSRWTFEVPFATPQGTGVVPFEIARDGGGAVGDLQKAPWRARFSLDLEPMGPVHALVTLSGDRASVTLWAERTSTASNLNDNVALLGDALRAAELQPSDLTFRVGTPRTAKPAAPGRFMDRAS